VLISESFPSITKSLLDAEWKIGGRRALWKRKASACRDSKVGVARTFPRFGKGGIELFHFVNLAFMAAWRGLVPFEMLKLIHIESSETAQTFWSLKGSCSGPEIDLDYKALLEVSLSRRCDFAPHFYPRWLY
jgi:hypothetical protein